VPGDALDPAEDEGEVPPRGGHEVFDGLQRVDVRELLVRGDEDPAV